ncbi:MAG TPA: hypothetical protein VLH81_08605, partial [Desulfobacterales bacterium]|nr:hypothetical protein [Desulfobacterales bacterium]
IVLTIGWDNYVIPAKPSTAGKLLELLSEAVPVRKDFSVHTGQDTYRIQPKRANVTVQVVGREQILPPKPEDFEGKDFVELKQLTGAVRLLSR